MSVGRGETAPSFATLVMTEQTIRIATTVRDNRTLAERMTSTMSNLVDRDIIELEFDLEAAALSPCDVVQQLGARQKHLPRE